MFLGAFVHQAREPSGVLLACGLAMSASADISQHHLTKAWRTLKRSLNGSRAHGCSCRCSLSGEIVTIRKTYPHLLNWARVYMVVQCNIERLSNLIALLSIHACHVKVLFLQAIYFRNGLLQHAGGDIAE
jgi:hypothetical protein